jgi:SAM-dependent methyltransferase
MVRAVESCSKALDVIESAAGRNRDIPPYSLRRMVGAPPFDFSGDLYRLQGPRWLSHLSGVGALASASSILDIGCGCGRVAGEILAHKKPEVRFVGFDIRKDLIDWAQAHLQPQFENARFFLADLHNARYNDRAPFAAAAYAFPFAEDEFDLIYATSVFTHLLDDAFANYFTQIGRVLRPGGKFVGTFFLLDIEHPRPDGRTALGPDGVMPWKGGAFLHQFGKAYSPFATIPERMLGYRMDDVVAFADAARLKITGVHPGFWKYGGTSMTWQDLLVIERA